MRRLQLTVIAMSLTTACGGSQPAASEPTAEESRQGESSSSGGDEFQLSSSDTAGEARGERPSEIVATATEAAMRLFVVDPESGPTSGVVIKMTAPDGQAYYTRETDSQGYAEVLVPAGQRYELEYLSLGRQSARARVEVPAGPNQDIRLTLRHRRWRPPARVAVAPQPGETAPPPEPQGLVLEGILFDSGRATLQAESNPRLDRVVEYMTHMPNVRIRIAGHTDNVGNPRTNQALSEQRAGAVRDYLVSHGIDASRIEAVGYGDQQPVASNDSEEGRQQNRRIEAIEL
ncbi:MAG: OmpA family protein [Myxococcota bacterium]|nr:OmpA family protein [Myxococcota bacterium]